jgi:hypothetical protein
MVSIYDSIKNAKTQRTFTIELENGISFVVQVEQRKQRRLINQYVRASLTQSKQTGTEQTVNIEPDWYGLGCELSDSIVDWSGFDEPFDKSAAVEFIALYGGVAEALGQGFKTMLDKYETALLEKKEIEIKNS